MFSKPPPARRRESPRIPGISACPRRRSRRGRIFRASPCRRDLVGGVDLGEFRLRALVAGVAVRMVLLCELAVGALDLGLARGAADARARHRDRASQFIRRGRSKKTRRDMGETAEMPAFRRSVSPRFALVDLYDGAPVPRSADVAGILVHAADAGHDGAERPAFAGRRRGREAAARRCRMSRWAVHPFLRRCRPPPAPERAGGLADLGGVGIGEGWGKRPLDSTGAAIEPVVCGVRCRRGPTSSSRQGAARGRGAKPGRLAAPERLGLYYGYATR